MALPNDRSSTSSLQKVGSSTELSIIPVNKNRSKHVDFTIICKDRVKGTTIKYGVEKAVIASASTFFNDLFEVCSVKGKDNKEELEMVEMDSKTVLKFLEVISGVSDLYPWPIDQSADVIELGYKYGADTAVERGLMKFCRSFADQTVGSKPIVSRYGKATIIKFISLWRRMINEGLFGSAETVQFYFWAIDKLWSSWCIRCNTDSSKAKISDFIDYESGKYFSGDDICVASVFIDNLRQGMHDKDLERLFNRLKKEKLESTQKS